MQRSRGGASRGGGRRSSTERGLTLLELVIALTVLSIMLFGVAATIDSGLGLTRSNRHRSVAANLASQEMDLIRSADFASLTALDSVHDVSGIPYTVHRELTWVPRDATNGPCDGANGDPELLRAHVWVSWPDMAGVKAPSADTVLTPPVGAYDPNTGHVAVRVLDRNAVPAFGVSVSIVGPESASLPTNSDGCAFFAFLTAGTYTVSLNTTNWVDRQGYQNPSDTVGVNVGQVSSVQFDYDQRAKIAVNVVGTYSTNVPTGYSLTVFNTGLLPAGIRSYTGSTNPRTISNLFPYVDGYSVWAGSCADADPEGLDINGDPYYSGAIRNPPLQTTPGVTTGTDLTMTPLRIQVVNGGGPDGLDDIYITHAADHVCSTGEMFWVGATDSTGIIDLELPYGSWTLSVDGEIPQTAWPVIALSPLDPLPRTDLTVSVA